MARKLRFYARLVWHLAGWGEVDPRLEQPGPPCGATDWTYCDDETTAHVYRVCTMPAGHEGRRHTEMRAGRVWAESSGDDGPVVVPPCIHTAIATNAKEKQ